MLVPNLEEWESHGISEHFAKQWLKNGFDMENALSWYENGFSLESAKVLKDEGLTPLTAKTQILKEIKDGYQFSISSKRWRIFHHKRNQRFI